MHSRIALFRSSPQGQNSKPRVAVLMERSDSAFAAELMVALSSVFRCSVHTAAQAPAPDLIGDADMVIWQIAGESTSWGYTDIEQLLGATSPARPVLVITERVDGVAFDRISNHVTEFVVSPFTCEELVLRARRVMGLHDAETAGSTCSDNHKLESIIVGSSAVLKREVEKLKRFAACDAGVLVLGETGTGKEVFAQAVHYVSARAAKPMVAINCGAVPPDLMEAELFGHVKGAYTNAHSSRAGLVNEAQGGTLFLDDVDCLAASAQAKLLRFLQEREYRVVGSNEVKHADVRVVAASNRDLAEMARQGSFRQDLYYRLNVLTLSLPPLREHREDIAALASHFLREFGQHHKQPARPLSQGALLKLLSHDWPGNVRELGHVLERALLLAQGSVLEPADIDLPAAVGHAHPTESFQVMKARVVQSFERSYIECVLSSSHGNIAEAARAAGKNRRALFELIRKHDITPASFKAVAGS
jgi:two-component system, NtrC family, response regulator GlrR